MPSVSTLCPQLSSSQTRRSITSSRTKGATSSIRGLSMLLPFRRWLLLLLGLGLEWGMIEWGSVVRGGRLITRLRGGGRGVSSRGRDLTSRYGVCGDILYLLLPQ